MDLQLTDKKINASALKEQAEKEGEDIEAVVSAFFQARRGKPYPLIKSYFLTCYILKFALIIRYYGKEKIRKY